MYSVLLVTDHWLAVLMTYAIIDRKQKIDVFASIIQRLTTTKNLLFTNWTVRIVMRQLCVT